MNTAIVFVESIIERRKTLEKEKIDAFAANPVVLIGLALNSYDPDKFWIQRVLLSGKPRYNIRRSGSHFSLSNVSSARVGGGTSLAREISISNSIFSRISSGVTPG